MKNLHVISTVILLILIGVGVGYFLFGNQLEDESLNVSEIGPAKVSENVSVVNTSQEFNLSEQIANLSINALQNPPTTIEGKMSFIKPEEAKSYLDKMNFTGENDSLGKYTPLSSRDEYWEILDFLDKFFFRKDINSYGVKDYWATPSESLTRMAGDEEDWAIALVSLMHARNDSYKCYIVGNKDFEGGVVCYLGKSDQFYRFGNGYFDDWGTNAGTMWRDSVSIELLDINQEKRIQLREFRNSFLDSTVGYCCVTELMDKRDKTITFAYNEKEHHEFKSGEEFIDWLMSFM